jgi:hypothetical protein
VTLQNRMRWARAFVLGRLLSSFAIPSLALAGFAAPAPEKKEKTKPEANEKIDAGTFAIVIKGQRVASETFNIEQKNGISITKSEVKETGGSDSPSQKSDLEITSTGELLRYDWSQSTGGSLMVFPQNEFLKETITTSAGAKPAEQAFLLPPVTSILDNNFFVHRELLIWKYLATAPCKDENGQRQCQSVDFGALVPQDRISMAVRMALVGKEKVAIHGVERELLRLNLTGEGFEWSLWVDPQNQFKLIRVAIPADNTEVVRD